MRHGNFHGIVGEGDGLRQQAGTLVAEENGEPALRSHGGIVDGNGAVAECHSRGAETEVVQGGDALFRPDGLLLCFAAGIRKADVGPRDLKDGADTDPDGAAVQRVAAGGSEQNGVDGECRGRAEDRSDIGRVLDIFEYGDAAGVPDNILHRRKRSAPERAEDSTGQVIAGDTGQDGERGSIDRERFAAAAEDRRGFCRQIFCLKEQGERFVPGVHGAEDCIGAFCDEDAGLRLIIVTELVLVQMSVWQKLRRVQVSDGNDVWHGGCFLSVFCCIRAGV